jgi:hypothetical protein
VPAGLEALILACLAKEPKLRPASAAALRDALRELDVDVGRWSESAAREWWERWRRDPRAEPAPAAVTARSPTPDPSA